MRKTALLVSVASLLAVGVTDANAQFGDLIKGLKGAAEGISKAATEAPKAPPAPAAAPAPVAPPAAAQAAPQAAQAPQPAPQATATPAAAKKLDLEWPESEYAFACNVKGKTLAVSKHFDSDDPNMRVSYGKRDARTQLSELDFRTDAKNPLLVNEINGQRRTVTSVYFTVKDTTYSISKCDGMMCSPEETYWMSSFKGGKLVNQAACDEEPVIDWNMPVATDKAGKIRTNPSMKDVIQVRPSKINFDWQR